MEARGFSMGRFLFPLFLVAAVFQDLLASLGTTFSQGSTNEQVGEGPLSFQSLSWRQKIGSEISEGSLRVGLSLFW